MVNGRLNDHFLDLRPCHCRHCRRYFMLELSSAHPVNDVTVSNINDVEEQLSFEEGIVVSPPPSYNSLFRDLLNDEPPRYQLVTGRQLNYGTASLLNTRTSVTVQRLGSSSTSTRSFLRFVLCFAIFLSALFIALVLTLVFNCSKWEC